jgi:hypothetical protein
LPDPNTDSYFTRAFGRPLRELTCECERTAEPSVAQALHIANGETLNAKLRDANSVIGKALAAKTDHAKWFEEVCLAALSRPPTEAEKQAVADAIREAGADPRPVMEDALWALMSTREFLFNH